MEDAAGYHLQHQLRAAAVAALTVAAELRACQAERDQAQAERARALAVAAEASAERDQAVAAAATASGRHYPESPVATHLPIFLDRSTL